MKYLYLFLMMTAVFSFGCQKDDNVNPDDYSDDFGTYTDERDGQQYDWVKIGDQIWMAENLAYLPEVTPITEANNHSPRYYVYDYTGTEINAAKESDNYRTYGVLYNWPAAKESCPAGWHLPSYEEWEQLALFITYDKGYKGLENGEYYRNVGKDLKTTGSFEDGTGLWHKKYPADGIENETEVLGTNYYKFSAVPGGTFNGSSKSFAGKGYLAYWWTSTVSGEYNAKTLHVNPYQDLIGGSYYHLWKSDGLSVRCIKDNPL